jgi:ABC-type uncharacterized transport system substrate-binding protein
VSRRLALLAVTLSFVSGVEMLSSLLVRAAEPAQGVARVGFVSPQSPARATPGINAFWERLRQLGYIEGKNLIIEARWAEGRYDRLPALMAEVLGRKVDVLVTHTTLGAIAARNATGTTPIVVLALSDPVRSGLTTSLSHPNGNLTGLSLGFDKALAGKWLELLQEMIPRMAYAPNFAMVYARAADYVDKILKGAKPGDLPIEQPSQFELVVNLKTARALNLTIPASILLRADEVIK